MPPPVGVGTPAPVRSGGTVPGRLCCGSPIVLCAAVGDLRGAVWFVHDTPSQYRSMSGLLGSSYHPEGCWLMAQLCHAAGAAPPRLEDRDRTVSSARFLAWMLGFLVHFLHGR